MEWYSKMIYKRNIVYQTKKAVLIQIPEGNELSGFSFWFPVSMVNFYIGITLRYSEKWVFTLSKKTRDNKVIDKVELTAAQFSEITFDEEYMPLLHTPKKLEPEKTVALEELMDNE